MCRFKKNNIVTISFNRNRFKYITCVGSSLLKMSLTAVVAGLNTSHVSVQVNLLFITCIGYFGLNTSHVSVQAYGMLDRFRYSEFKYITCVGSSLLIFFYAPSLYRLNTSHVSVQASNISTSLEVLASLNTSHVSVQALQ